MLRKATVQNSAKVRCLKYVYFFNIPQTEVVMDFFYELVITYLFSYPGAFIRMLFLRATGNKITFSKCLEQDVTQNAFLGFLLLGVLIILFSYFS